MSNDKLEKLIFTFVIMGGFAFIIHTSLSIVQNHRAPWVDCSDCGVCNQSPPESMDELLGRVDNVNY